MAEISHVVPPGKLHCFITGKPRLDTPEENVRQRWARSLVDEYGYPKSDIGVEVSVRMGRAKKRVDLAVYRHEAPHEQEHVLIYVECKRDDKPLGEDSEGQFKSYMAASASCAFGMLVAKERRAFAKEARGGFVPIPDIPRFGQGALKRPLRSALVRTHELSSVFRRCHNYIYANEGLQKADAFHELIKLIFCKTYDEEESGEELLFGVDPKERMSESGQMRLMEERVVPLFDKVKKRFPFIFDKDDAINLNPRVVAYIVAELQYLSLLDTDLDVKGSAYEELVGSNLRGDRGEYFTPRNVCDMAVRMVTALYETNAEETKNLTELKVLDCCSGTGGFLVSWLNNLHTVLLRQESARPPGNMSPAERARRRLYDFCIRNLYGLDINPTLVRACQMNLVLHGDGSSNVFRADSVRSPSEWSEAARQAIPYGAVDVLFTNPPFGGRANIDDRQVLSQYELASWDAPSARRAMPAEQLFIEAALKFLKPGGHLAIVVPDGIVNNPGLRFIRSWLLRRAVIVASVSLPKTTFAASKGINNPTVLIVRKFSEEQARQADLGIQPASYKVFMSRPETAGISLRNKPIYLAQPDGSEVVDGDGQKIRNDEIQGVAEAFESWLSKESSG